MPVYAYACTACGHAFDARQSFDEPSLTVCEACGGALRKQFGTIGVTFNGSGFYRTDSRASGSGGSDAAGGGSGSDSSGSGSSGAGSGSSGSGTSGSGTSGSGSSGSGSSGSSSGSGSSKAATPAGSSS